MVAGEGNVCLLLTSGSVEGVDLLDLDFVKLLTGLLDHLLVGFLVNDEDKSVAVLDGLDSRLRAQWVLDDRKFVEGVNLIDSSQNGLWASFLSESLWSSECCLSPNFGLSSCMGSLLDSC